ncbi:MAG: hypothetical protein ACRDM8_03350 [Gaiellaceae bacterium]
MTVEKALVVLGTVVAVAYLLAGVVVGLWPSVWDDTGTDDQIFWIVFLVGGGLLLLGGLRMSKRSPWLSAALISLGALAGAIPTFWTVLAPIAALTLVVLSIVYARRATSAAPATG